VRIQGADIDGFRLELSSVTSGAHSMLTALDDDHSERIRRRLNAFVRELFVEMLLPIGLPSPSDERKALLDQDGARHAE
jgi:hypothetical protein